MYKDIIHVILLLLLTFFLASAGAPLTTKEKDLLRYYYYIHNGIDTRFVASINQTWFKRIMAMVPRRLLRNQVGSKTFRTLRTERLVQLNLHPL